MADKGHYQPQSKHPDQQVDASHEKGQQERKFNELPAAGLRNGRKGGQYQQAHDGDRPGSQLPQAAPQGSEQGRNRTGIEAVYRRESSQHGIGHGLGDQHHGDGQTGNGIAFQKNGLIRLEPR